MRYGVLMILLTIAAIATVLLSSVACVSRPSAPEPPWRPDSYSVDRRDGCFWMNESDDEIACDSPGLEEMVMLPAHNLLDAQIKINRCESWR
jgi:hypothetical protein